MRHSKNRSRASKIFWGLFEYPRATAVELCMKVEAVQTTKSIIRKLSSSAGNKKNQAAISFGAAKRGVARRIFVARADIIRGVVRSDAPTPRAILRMVSSCH